MLGLRGFAIRHAAGNVEMGRSVLAPPRPDVSVRTRSFASRDLKLRHRIPEPGPGAVNNSPDDSADYGSRLIVDSEAAD